MIVKVFKSYIIGEIVPPSSKSEVHRLIICAFLSRNQKTIIKNVDLNNDLNETIYALKKIGTKIEYINHDLIVYGYNYERKKKLSLYIKESATTLRFIIPLFSYFVTNLTIKLGKTLLKRPLDCYKDILKDKLIIENDIVKINDTFKTGVYELKGDISSQFFSGLLFLLPLENFDSLIKITVKLESEPYLKLTIDTLAKFNVKVDYLNNQIFIKGKQKYISSNLDVEKDFSSASNFLVLGVLTNKISCLSLNLFSHQADKEIINIIKKMQGEIYFDDRSITVLKSTLQGGEFDMNSCIDLTPIVIVLALFASSSTHLKNIKRLKYKESNRGLVMQEELLKVGIKIDVKENDIYINPPYKIKKADININPHSDHRILMAFVILGLVLDLNIVIDDAECVNKSYPSFYEDIKFVHGNIKLVKE